MREIKERKSYAHTHIEIDRCYPSRGGGGGTRKNFDGSVPLGL